MKKSKHLLLSSVSILVILVIFIIANKHEYKYGTIYSSINSDKSYIYTYDDNGKYVSNEKINVGGITLASLMKFGITSDDYIYYGCPISENSGNNYTLQLNKNNLNVKKIKSNDTTTPTHFSVDNKYIYSADSDLTTTYLSKTDIEENKVLAFTEIKGQGMFMLNDSKNLYLMTTITDSETYVKIYILDKNNFKVNNTIDLKDSTFITDSMIINNTLYILQNRDGLDNLSNKLISIDLKDFSVNSIILPFDNLFKMHHNGNYLYVVEGDYTDINTHNKIAKINLQTNDIDVFNSKSNNKTSYISNNEFISSDGEYIYIYDIENFNIKNQFDIAKVKNHNFVSFYIKN